MSYPRSYRGIKDAVRAWAYRVENARSIIRKSGFRPLAGDPGIPRPILSLEGSKRGCFSPDVCFPQIGEEWAVKDGDLYWWGGVAPVWPTRHPQSLEFGGVASVAAGQPDFDGQSVVGEDGTVYYSGFWRSPDDNVLRPLSGAPEDAIQAAFHIPEAPSGSFYFLSADGTVWHMGTKGAGMSSNQAPPESWQWRDEPPDVVQQMPTDKVSNVLEIACQSDGLIFREAGGSVGIWRWQSSTLAPDKEFPEYPSGQPSGVTKIAGYGPGAVVLTEDGEVWASGANDAGQYGNGTVTANSYASWHKADGSGYTDIATANNSILAVRDGTLWSWGSGGVRSARGFSSSNATTPQEVGVEGTEKVFGNWSTHAPMLKKDDGCVMIWGDNQFGYLGRGYIGGYEENPQNLPISEAYPPWPV